MWNQVYNDTFDAEKSCRCEKISLKSVVVICVDRFTVKKKKKGNEIVQLQVVALMSALKWVENKALLPTLQVISG